MGATKQIPPEEWKPYFDRFTRQYLSDDAAETVTIEVMSPTLGDQFEARSIRLLGATYDPKSSAFELLLEDLDHLVFRPTEIWVIEEPGGFVSALELVRVDGEREIVYVHREGRPPRPATESSAPAR